MAKEVSQAITCPSCGATIQLTEALLFPFREEWRKQWDVEAKGKFDSDKRKALEEQEQTIAELNSKLVEKDKKLKETQQYERDLRQKLDKLEEREKELDLEIARKVDEKVAEQSGKHSKEIAEKNELIKQMQKQIEELKERSEQISPQTKGDALQFELERMLKSSFPDDDIEIVKKGVKGADIIQRVKDKNNNMQICGTILWESKNTTSWNNSWIPKLKNDQRDKKADIAVIASIIVPENITNFSMIENVWITRLPVACCLSDVLRFSLIEITNNRLSLEGRDQKMETLFSYFAGPEFKQRIEPVVEALLSMQKDIEHEKRAMESLWATREKELEKAIKGATGFYSDIRGIIGRALLPQIGSLQLLTSRNEPENS